MTFQASAELPASERFMLVRVTPRKFLGVGVDIGGGQYTFNIGAGFNVAAVTVNEVDEPTWSYSSGVLTVTSATNLTLSQNIITIDHDLYLTATKVRYTDGVSGVPDAEWLPLLASYPSFSQSMRNIAEGVFSLSNTDIEIISTDRLIQSLLADDSSLSKAPVTVWVCIDEVTTNRRIFDGEVGTVSYSYGKATLQVLDVFNRLRDTATFGAQSHITSGQNQNTAIPFVLGKSSPFVVNNGWRHVTAEGNPPARTLHLKEGNDGILIGPINPTKDTPTSWVLGRCIGGVRRINFGTVVGNTYYHAINTPVTVDYTFYDKVANPDYSFTEPKTYYIYDTVAFIQLQNINDFTGQIGDYIPNSYIGGTTTDGGWICGFGAGLYGSYNLAIAIQRFSYGQNLSDTPVSSSTGSALSLPNGVIPSMGVWVEAGDSLSYNAKASLEALQIVPNLSLRFGTCSRYLPFTLFETNDYTLNGQTVKRVDVLVSTSGEVNVGGSRLKYRFSPASEMTHGNALKFIVQAAGLETNDSTFTQADSDLAANVSLTIPMNGATAFDSYLKAAQAVTTSTLGVLRLNESRQVEYELIKNPSLLTVDATRTTLDMIQGDTRSDVQYQDVLTTVNFENKQMVGQPEIDGGGARSSIDFPKARQLHRTEKTKTIEHCLTSIQSRKAAIAGYLSSPTVEYSLATASEDLATKIGDVVEITNSAVASDQQTTVGIVVGLDQTGARSVVKINEIRGVQ
jgi:hypothetical protein